MTAMTNGDLAHKMRYITQHLRDHMVLHGYEEISLPIIEPAEIFLTRAGDTIIERLFTFERGGKQQALRPEFTASAAYRYSQQGENAAVRWQFNGVIFEDDPSRAGTRFERHSIGAEYIGQAGTDAEAEIIGMAIQGLERLEIKDWQLSIGHVGLQRHLLAKHKLDRRVVRAIQGQREVLRRGEQGLTQAMANLQAMLPQLPESASEMQASESETEQMLDTLLNSTGYGKTLGGRTRHDIALRMVDKRRRARGLENVQEALRQFQQWEQINGEAGTALEQVTALVDPSDQIARVLLTDWRALVNLLEAYGIAEERVRIQADLTRHWEYYTGVVFGIWSSEGDLLAAGGRYDDLAHLMGSQQPIPAVGFAYYTDALLGAIERIPPHPRILVFDQGELSPEVAVSVVQQLRAQSIPVKLETHAANADLRGTAEGLLCGSTAYALTNIEALIDDLKAAEE